MTWSVVWTRPAYQDMTRLDADVRIRVHEAVSRLAETGSGDVRKLRETTDEYRLRVGDWRVRFTYSREGKDAALVVFRVLHRREAYR